MYFQVLGWRKELEINFIVFFFKKELLTGIFIRVYASLDRTQNIVSLALKKFYMKSLQASEKVNVFTWTDSKSPRSQSSGHTCRVFQVRLIAVMRRPTPTSGQYVFPGLGS